MDSYFRRQQGNVVTPCCSVSPTSLFHLEAVIGLVGASCGNGRSSQLKRKRAVAFLTNRTPHRYSAVVLNPHDATKTAHFLVPIHKIYIALIFPALRVHCQILLRFNPL
jgi:hypothetical protein